MATTADQVRRYGTGKPLQYSASCVAYNHAVPVAYASLCTYLHAVNEEKESDSAMVLDALTTDGVETRSERIKMEDYEQQQDRPSDRSGNHSSGSRARWEGASLPL